MKSSIPQEWRFKRLDPKAFVAEPELIRVLEPYSASAQYEEDRILFRQGEPPDGLYIVHQGMVALAMTSENGESLFAAYALPGSLLGLPSLITEKPYTLSATACAGARVGFLGRDDFNRLLQSQPQLSARVLKVLAAQIRGARRALDDKQSHKFR